MEERERGKRVRGRKRGVMMIVKESGSNGGGVGERGREKEREI